MWLILTVYFINRNLDLDDIGIGIHVGAGINSIFGIRNLDLDGRRIGIHVGLVLIVYLVLETLIWMVEGLVYM